MAEAELIVEIVGEGKTDRGGGSDQPELPNSGIVPIIVHQLCGRPEMMRVRRRRIPLLQGKKLWQKVRFAKQQSLYSGSAGLVFVLDTEGKHPDILRELQHGRDFALENHPTAVGVAHPCIEAWLLADPSAISRAIKPGQQPEIFPEPESLPAPCQDRGRNPKILLGQCVGQRGPLSSGETTRIALNILDFDRLRTCCPISFVPFADEILERIKPIFHPIDQDLEPQ